MAEYFSYEILTYSATNLDNVEDPNLILKILSTEFATITNTENYDKDYLADIIIRARYYQKKFDFIDGEVIYSFYDYNG